MQRTSSPIFTMLFLATASCFNAPCLAQPTSQNQPKSQTQSIEDLLNSVDTTLKGKSSEGTTKDDKTVIKSKGSKKQSLQNESQPRDPSLEETQKAKESLSTPQVFEVPANVSIEPPKKPQSLNRVALTLLRRSQLKGGSLSKDEDSFTVKANESAFGAGLSASRDVLNSATSNQKPQNEVFIGLEANAFRGQVAMERRGVYNEDYKTTWTWIDWFLESEWRGRVVDVFFVGLQYGVGGETLSQAGRGVTDSASDGFTIDKGALSLTYLFSETFEYSLSFQKTGRIFLRSNDTPEAFAIGVNAGFRL